MCGLQQLIIMNLSNGQFTFGVLIKEGADSNRG
jgi:hypothetical protein